MSSRRFSCFLAPIHKILKKDPLGIVTSRRGQRLDPAPAGLNVVSLHASHLIPNFSVFYPRVAVGISRKRRAIRNGFTPH